MAWVPLASSGLQYLFLKEDPLTGADVPGLPDFVSFSPATSIIALSQPGTPHRRNANWTLHFPGSSKVEIRITAIGFLGEGGVDGDYDSAYFSYLGQDQPAVINNEAQAGGSGNVESFIPTRFEATLHEWPDRGDPAWLYYGSSSYPDDGAWVETDLAWSFQIEVFVDRPAGTSYNCACDDDYPRTTLGALRNRLATRLGFATQVAMGVLPPGMSELLDDFIRNAQEMLYRRYAVFRMERFYAWDMEPGVRFYDFGANADACPKRMDPRMVTWVGISQGDLSWRPLVCGIDPVMYGSPSPGIPSHYEIRQCIEVWPAPVDDTWKLRIKGHFGLLSLDTDSDETTIDPEAIFLQALANAKAHYGQADAGNYAAQATAYVRSLIAGSHHTRRYVPGTHIPPPAVRPVMKEG